MILLSSAHILMRFSSPLGKSLIDTTKRNDPKTDHCGTSFSMSLQPDSNSPITTL